MLIEQAVFLVGGQGTRLGELTANTPKPLLNVGGIPFLDYLIRNVCRFGVRKVLLLAGYLGESIKTHYAGFALAHGIEIECIIEPKPAGTGGALRFARDELEEVFFLLNGDTFFDINMLDLAVGFEDTDWLAKMALRRISEASRYGVVRLEGDRISAIGQSGGLGEGLINGGAYVLRKSVVDALAREPCSLEVDIFPVLAKSGRLAGKVYDGFFLDIGIPSDFDRAQSAIPAQLRRGAVFFDRDGVLNEDSGYVHSPEAFVWRPGAIEAIKRVNDAGLYAFVVTNQAGIARGYYSEAAVVALHDWMRDQLARHGAHIDAFYYCPHHPQGTLAEYAIECTCRKPAPGMILAAMRHWSVEPARSFLIGDNPWDVEAARAAGIRGVLSEDGDLCNEVRRELSRLPGRAGQ